jgi:hypothetical protein
MVCTSLILCTRNYGLRSFVVAWTRGASVAVQFCFTLDRPQVTLFGYALHVPAKRHPVILPGSPLARSGCICPIRGN